jgi:uncharacterized protein YeaO (DUF488 family)
VQGCSDVRVYDPPGTDDGTRVLVGRMWRRGLAQVAAALDEWCREIAPSDELRTWYRHDPARFDEFAARYRAELGEPSRAAAVPPFASAAAAARHPFDLDEGGRHQPRGAGGCARPARLIDGAPRLRRTGARRRLGLPAGGLNPRRDERRIAGCLLAASPRNADGYARGQGPREGSAEWWGGVSLCRVRAGRYLRPRSAACGAQRQETGERRCPPGRRGRPSPMPGGRRRVEAMADIEVLGSAGSSRAPVRRTAVRLRAASARMIRMPTN